VKAAGGLAIIGTERHESRRVDRQLRGRAGRQGDPGSSVFYVSLEDDLMRLFSSDRIVKLMDRMGFEEGEVIEHNMISKSIERAQKKVEENHFGVRKRLLEYDDVMNAQREVIYTKRRHALMGERIGVDIANMMYDTTRTVVEEAHSAEDYEGLNMEMLRVMTIEAPFDEEEFKSERINNLSDKTYNELLEAFKRKMDKLAGVAYPVIKNVFEEKGDYYKNILVPVTDGKRIYNISTGLEDAYKTEGKDVVRSFEKAIMLLSIDEAWKEHLRELDELRQSVQNASYEQKDPLLIYKLESFGLFKTMIESINKKVISILMRGQIPVQEPGQLREASPERRQDLSRYRTQREDLGGMGAGARQDTRENQHREPIRVEKKVGRNEPCPCGSGTKYKSCCG
jgi:preprotein translocase subunit SecA